MVCMFAIEYRERVFLSGIADIITNIGSPIVYVPSLRVASSIVEVLLMSENNGRKGANSESR